MKMTLEQHREFGEHVKEFMHHLRKWQCVGTKASRESRAVASALRYIDRMKFTLDGVACRDFPDCKDVTQIYYGKSATEKTL